MCIGIGDIVKIYINYIFFELKNGWYQYLQKGLQENSTKIGPMQKT